MSFQTSKICASCSTKPSVTLCEGCQRKLCRSCLDEHRRELSLELDDLFNRRNELMEKMNTTDTSSDFDKINRWQAEMHANIDRIATEARSNVRQMMSETSQNVRKELDQISKDLQEKQKTDGYLENDLAQIKQQLLRLNLTLQQSIDQIHVDTSPSKNINWNSLLFITSNRSRQTNSTAPSAPASPALYSSFDRKANNTMPMSRQQHFSYPASSPHISQSSNIYQPASGRSASVSMGSRPITYTCIGCKTTNVLNENGRSYCSVCRSPAPF